MREYYEKHRAMIHKAAYVAGFLLAVYVVCRWLLGFVLPFVVGLLISAALSPLANLLERRLKVGRGVISGVLLLLGVTLVVVVGTLGVSRAGREFETLSANLPALTDRLRGLLDSARAVVSGVASFVPEDYRAAFDRLASQTVAAIGEALAEFVRSRSVRVVVSLPNALINILMSVLAAFFFMKDGAMIRAALRRVSGAAAARQANLIRGGLARAVGGYARAQLLLMALVGSICALGLTLMGNPYAILIAALAAFIDALPVFGLGAIFWPWIAVSFLDGDLRQGIGLSVVYAVGFLSRHLLEPKIVGQQIGVHPLLTLFSLYVGMKLFGLPGLLLGPMVVITLKMSLSTAENAGETPP